MIYFSVSLQAKKKAKGAEQKKPATRKLKTLQKNVSGRKSTSILVASLWLII